MSITAYPLQWPPGLPRSKTREAGRFKATLPGALKNVEDSLRFFAGDSFKKLDGVVLSSNVTLGAVRPVDPGVAVWFTWDSMGVCIAVDRYTTVESNLRAVHHIIEARRVELRHGTLALVRATFQGLLALPAPPGAEWWQILGVAQTADAATTKDAYRKLASAHHPDRGGNAERMSTINDAYRLSAACLQIIRMDKMGARTCEATVRAVRAVDRGATVTEAAKKHGVDRRTIQRARKKSLNNQRKLDLGQESEK